MAATLSKKSRGTSATRLLSAYLAMTLVFAMVGPGLSVYAAEGEVLPEAVESSPAEAPSDEPVAEPAEVPAVESEPVAPAPEPNLAPVPETIAPAELAPVEAPVPVRVLASVAPVLSPDPNPPLTSGGVRIEDPSTGTYTSATVDDSKPPVPSDFSIQLTTWETDEGWFVSFTSNYPISLVVVKGGNAGANLYSYDPPVYSDTALHAPANPNGKWAGLSHLDFYFGTIPEEPETGELLVHKFYDENGNGLYEPGLGEYLLEGWEFTVTGTEFSDSGMTDADGMVLFTGLLPGTYSVTETLKAGWDNTTALTQSAEVVAGQTAHLYFGNMEESLPFTELDLAITKLADKSSAKPGELITYTLTYRNLGDLPATNYTIVDDYDERYVTVVSASGGVVSGGKITWSLAGPLTKEAGPQTLTYTVRVKSEMPVGTTNVDNVVVISHPLDENPANDRDDERVVVTMTDEFLPFTGGEYQMLLYLALLAAIGGLALRAKERMS